MFYDPLKDTRTGDEDTPKPPFRVGINVNKISMYDEHGSEFTMDELSIFETGSEDRELSGLRRFIEAEALEDISEGFNSGPYVEFLIYPTGFRLASLDEVDDAV